MSRVVLVTGATGFVGRHACDEVVRRGETLRACVRREARLPSYVEQIIVPDLGDRAALRPALDGVTTVLHFAGRAHHVHDRPSDADTEFKRTNVDCTAALLREAAAAGVSRFVYASSIKAVGSEHDIAESFTERSAPHPTDGYARSKLEAEQLTIAANEPNGMTTSVVRFPLVYGPGVRANMLSLFRLVDRGIPLPLGLVRNRRSLLFVGNAVDASVVIAAHPAASGEVFFATDGAPVSSADLIRAIASALGKQALLIPVPPALIQVAGLAGDAVSAFMPFPVNSGVLRRLTGSLVADDRKLRALLGWRPPFTLAQGLAQTAAWYRANA